METPPDKKYEQGDLQSAREKLGKVIGFLEMSSVAVQAYLLIRDMSEKERAAIEDNLHEGVDARSILDPENQMQHPDMILYDNLKRVWRNILN